MSIEMVVSEYSTETVSIEELARRLRPPLLRRFASEAKVVSEIVADVAERGDAALIEHTRRLHWPGAAPELLEVTAEEFAAAERAVPSRQRGALQQACALVRQYQTRCAPETWIESGFGKTLGQRWRALDRVGIYVPGGTPLPSTVYMCAMPAQVASVREVILTTPAGRDGTVHPLILVAARVSAVHRVFKVGGAQAIAALAFGTATIPKVDKIVGPGSIWVTLAKREVFGAVGIESLPGPSDILVIGDGSVRARWVAADLLSQAEHGELSSAILCTPSADYLAEVRGELACQLAELPRASEAAASLAGRGALVLCRDLAECAALANLVAPEHLEIAVVRDPESIADRVSAAGAIFLGPFTPEAVGDYVAGPSHVLPTEGTARFASALGVEDFMRRTSIVRYERETLAEARDDVEALAEAEGLAAHARSVSVRFE
jgi:histidinol dehydrogenase